jgi:hypothetical protein
LKKKEFLLLTLFLLFSVSDLLAQEVWTLKQDKEGIKIYSSPFAESKIKALKVVCSFECTLSQLTAVLLDIDCQDEWFYHTKSSVLRKISPFELYYYAELYFPFPFSNRDFIEHIKVSQDTQTKVVTMSVQNVPDYISPKTNFIRVMESQCNWTITPISKNLVSVEFTLFADPAGSIPQWLVNMVSYYGPFETFKKLKIQLKKPEYAQANLAFIRD